MTAEEFIIQLETLRLKTPVIAIVNIGSENSEYCPYAARNKNCYLLYGYGDNEDCYYGNWVGFSKDCVDNNFVYKSELCYECLDCTECYNGNYLQDCHHCIDCSFGYDLIGCQNCIGCIGLRQKQYHLFNIPVSKKIFEQARREMWKHQGKVVKKFEELQLKMPRIVMNGWNNENVVGDHINHSKNSYYCFDVEGVEDTLYCTNVFHVNDFCDVNYGQRSELTYECMSAFMLTNSNFCNYSWESSDLEYCELVFNSKNCFGCFSVQNKQYCILNEQFPKEAYEQKVKAIKDDMKKKGLYGRYHLPSPYTFEESAASLYFSK